jgi:hypothetical protein
MTEDSNTDGNQPLQEQSRTEWAAQKRAALVGRIKEIKKMLQETNVSGVGLVDPFYHHQAPYSHWRPAQADCI